MGKLLALAPPGSSVLRRRAAFVSTADIVSGRHVSFVRGMQEAMLHHGGIGLAAPQVGRSLRIIAVHYPFSPSLPHVAALPPLALYNPVVTPVGSATLEMWEGCLSVPGVYGLVKRHAHVTIQWVDEEGSHRRAEAEGFLAGLFQHEADHLDGILLTDRTDARHLIPEDRIEEVEPAAQLAKYHGSFRMLQ